jgi:hypothetical protein
MISKLNEATNVIALLVIGMGVAISIKQPGIGHDLIMGGLGALGGAAATRREPAAAALSETAKHELPNP